MREVLSEVQPRVRERRVALWRNESPGWASRKIGDQPKPWWRWTKDEDRCSEESEGKRSDEAWKGCKVGVAATNAAAQILSTPDELPWSEAL